jgi:hypothetical protein
MEKWMGKLGESMDNFETWQVVDQTMSLASFQSPKSSTLPEKNILLSLVRPLGAAMPSFGSQYPTSGHVV